MPKEVKDQIQSALEKFAHDPDKNRKGALFMLQSEKQNVKAKEDIKTAWNEGDMVGLFRAGFENFMNMIGRSSPMPFQKFLEYTGMSFDKYILDTSKQG